MKHLETPMRTIYDRDFERYTTHIQVDRANYVLVLSPNEHDSKERAEEIVTAVNNYEKMKEALELVRRHGLIEKDGYESLVGKINSVLESLK